MHAGPYNMRRDSIADEKRQEAKAPKPQKMRISAAARRKTLVAGAWTGGMPRQRAIPLDARSYWLITSRSVWERVRPSDPLTVILKR